MLALGRPDRHVGMVQRDVVEDGGVLNDDGALAHEIVEQFCGGRDGVSVGNHARVFGEIHMQSLFLRRARFELLDNVVLTQNKK